AETVTVDLPQAEVTRLVGIELSVEEIKQILESLEFQVEITGSQSPNLQSPISNLQSPLLHVTVPDHRLDISAEPVTGRADLVEEIARVYGYDRVPVTELTDELPPQRNNRPFEREERTRDLLIQTGLQEVITYRLTTPEVEARILGKDYVEKATYVTLANPSTPERSVMRHSVLNSVLEIVAENSKRHARVELFEVGHVYLPNPNGVGEAAILPDEKRRLVIAMTGPRSELSWLPTDAELMDFFDLKGVVESLLDGLHLDQVAFKPAQHHAFYPGRVANLEINGQSVGLLGQLHPYVVEAYDIQIEEDQPVLAADFDLDVLLVQTPDLYAVRSVPRFPPVQQDIALVVDDIVPADQVYHLIMQTGRPLLTEASLFDVFRGEQIGAGKKSLAFSLTFQSEETTLTDKVVAKQQQKIVKRLEHEIGAQLRG
ncbi:MAG: phenylalanine--tRNA ligase subunit beta, partial [Anaerolineales bacterium]|nr:phenylalanine--tRNA ligase subunit beta [Anaerolineales bacterium]